MSRNRKMLTKQALLLEIRNTKELDFSPIATPSKDYLREVNARETRLLFSKPRPNLLGFKFPNQNQKYSKIEESNNNAIGKKMPKKLGRKAGEELN